MIAFDNSLGSVSLTSNFFAELVSNVAKSCFGVAGMASSGTADNLRSLVRLDAPDKGVSVTEDAGELVIKLCIKVTYGLNIKTAARSISHKVKYVVEDVTGFKVAHVDVVVEDVIV